MGINLSEHTLTIKSKSSAGKADWNGIIEKAQAPRKQPVDRKKVTYCIIAAVIVLALMVFWVWKNQQKYTENDFGAYFRLEKFPMTIDEVMEREQDVYGETTYDRMDAMGLTAMSFPAGISAEQEYRTYLFKDNRLIRIEFCPQKQQGHLFLTAFESDHKKWAGGHYWFGHVGEDKVVLDADTSGTLGTYSLNLVHKDYFFPEKESFWDIWG